MRKHIQSWLVTLAVIFASSMGFHACSDDAVSIFLNLGETPSQLGEGGDVSIMASTSNSVCEGQCDGTIPEMYIATVGSALATEGDSVSISIDGASTYMVTGTLAATTAEASLISLIGADSEATGQFTVQAGSIELLPFNNLMVPGVGTETGGEGQISLDNNVRDTQALTEAMLGILLFDELDPDEIVGKGVADEAIPDLDVARDVALSTYQESDCDTGTVRLTQNLVVEIGADEMIAMSTLPAFEQSILSFSNCAITADWLGAMSDQTVTFNGKVTVTTLVDTDEGTEQMFAVGTVGVSTSDASMMPFWVSSVNFNMSWTDALISAPGDVNGGVCYGGSVLPGGTGDSDDDDTCTGTGTFVSATQFKAFVEYVTGP